jgi:hypothetical protein
VTHDEHNLPQLPPLEESSAKEEDFFGPSAERLQNVANQIKDEHGQGSTEYGECMVAVGNAHVISGAQSLGNALVAYEEALQSFTAANADTQRADVHHRIASILRRRAEHDLAAEHLRKAIDIWKQTGSTDLQYLHRLQEDLDAMRQISQQHRPGPPRI